MENLLLAAHATFIVYFSGADVTYLHVAANPHVVHDYALLLDIQAVRRPAKYEEDAEEGLLGARSCDSGVGTPSGAV